MIDKVAVSDSRVPMNEYRNQDSSLAPLDPSNGNNQHNNMVARKFVGKKIPRKTKVLWHGKCSRASSRDSVPTSKKVRKAGRESPVFKNGNDSNMSSTVPSSLASANSTKDSVVNPTDDEDSCSHVTEEEYCSLGDISTCSEEDKTSTSVLQPALRFSAFPCLPPYLSFCLHDQKVVDLPWSVRRHLKWKLSSITPVVVRKTVVNSGFRIMKDPKDWMGTWGKHMKSPFFKELLPHQKVNHFPGTFQIGRKDRLWRNMQKMMAKYGSEEFDFLPQTYVLPHDLRLLRQVWSRNTSDVPWIIKPPASARGTGIQVIHQWNQLPRKKPLVVQSYVKNPLLINGRKFDIRLYVFVTSINPLKIYLYEDGLVRFASLEYCSDMESLGDAFVHLTNYSINKNSEGYIANEDASLCQGHKWTLKSLWKYLEERGANIDELKLSLKDIVIKTLLSVRSQLSEMMENNVAHRYSCYELFGFDVLLDSTLKPYLLEVNISPSLHSTSSLDLSVKGPLIRDVFNMARFHVPDNLNSIGKEDLSNYINSHFKGEVRERVEGTDDGSQYCMDSSLYCATLTTEEKTKQEFYMKLGCKEISSIDGSGWFIESLSACEATNKNVSSILHNLTANDIQKLMELEDECSQKQGFNRIFPSDESDSYFRFMENVHYYDLLLSEWQRKFGSQQDRSSAISFLKVHIDRLA